MANFFQRLLDSNEFAPHGVCISWRPDVFWLQAGADAVIALSYFSIPFALVYFCRRRPNQRFLWLTVLFSAFISLCGMTHALDVWTLWVPDYGVEALIKVVTALASLITAGVLWRLMPHALRLPTHRELERKNTELTEQRNFTQSVIESLPGIFYVLNAEGRFSLWNRNLERVTGYGAEEIAALHALDLFGGDEKALIGQRIAKVFTEGWADAEASLLGKTQERHPYYFTGQRMALGDGVQLVGMGIDISSRQAAEQALRDSEQRFRATFEQAAVGMAHIALDGRFLKVNQRYCDIVGYTSEEMLNLKFQDLTHPDDLAENEAAVHRVATGELENNAWEKRYIKKDGTVRWVRATGSIQRDANRTALHFIAVIEDIHARKEAEQRLAESEERFRSLVESTTDWVWETDREHRFSWFSPSLDKVLGHSSAHLIGKRRWDIAADDQGGGLTLWQQYVDNLAAHRTFRDFRYWLQIGDGSRKWVSISGSPRYDEKGQFLGYRGSGADITDKAEMSLRLRLLSKVVEQSPVSVVVTDPDGSIVYVNSYFTTMTGYEPDEVIGKTPRILSSGEIPQDVFTDMWRAISSGNTWSGELKNRKKNGDAHWEFVAISPIMDDDGSIVHYVSVKEDITYRKEAEAKLAKANFLLEDQALQLKQSNAELEQFAYVASHDLRQPLRMVSSYLGLIAKKLGQNLDAELKDFMGFALDGAKRMDALILGLLEYARAGRRDLPLGPVSLAGVLQDAMGNLAIAIQDADAQVGIADGLPMVTGDHMELVRLFQNLIGNALKYHAPGRSPMVTVDWQAQGGQWVIRVQDNGIGIAPQDQERVFGIFQRLVPEGQYEGTGIGLAVCRKIVEHHQGRIGIESVVGKGSTFIVHLPMVVP